MTMWIDYGRKQVKEPNALYGDIGSLLKPKGNLPDCWNQLLQEDEITIVLLDGCTNLAYFLLQNDMHARIQEIIIAGGNIMAHDAGHAEKHIHQDPYSAERLCNSQIPLTFCLLDTALEHHMTVEELAMAYGKQSDEYELLACGGHVETDPHALGYGKLIVDAYSDKQFEKQNIRILVGRKGTV